MAVVVENINQLLWRLNVYLKVQTMQYLCCWVPCDPQNQCNSNQLFKIYLMEIELKFKTATILSQYVSKEGHYVASFVILFVSINNPNTLILKHYQ